MSPMEAFVLSRNSHSMPWLKKVADFREHFLPLFDPGMPRLIRNMSKSIPGPSWSRLPTYHCDMYQEILLVDRYMIYGVQRCSEDSRHVPSGMRNDRWQGDAPCPWFTSPISTTKPRQTLTVKPVAYGVANTRFIYASWVSEPINDISLIMRSSLVSLSRIIVRRPWVLRQ